MVRKQHERTIISQSRIIPLSLPIQSFHILAPLAPFLQDWGLSLSHETFSHKFFPKFFSIRPRWLFSVFLVRKIMGVDGPCRSPNGGGVPLCMLSIYQTGMPFCPLGFMTCRKRVIVLWWCVSWRSITSYIKQAFIGSGCSRVRLLPTFVCFLILEFCTPWVFLLLESSGTPPWRISRQSGAKRGKSKHLFACFCLTLVILETERRKI